MIPVMGGWKVPFYDKASLQALSEPIQGLNIVIDAVNTSGAVSEVYIRCYESAIRHQKQRYLRQGLILMRSQVFEEALRHNDIELHIVKLDRVLHNIDLEKIRPRLRQCNVDAVVVD